MPRLIPALLTLGLSLAACAPQNPSDAQIKAIGDADRGHDLIAQVGCGACHQIPGVAGAAGLVGPPLDHIARRTVIAGVLPNNPQNLTHWLEAPQSVVPGNAMPNMELSNRDARDIAAYLYTLR